MEEFTDAADVIARGFGQKWFKPASELHQRLIVESLVRVNYARGGQVPPLSALRYYQRDGWMVICEGPNIDAEPHPNDLIVS